MTRRRAATNSSSTRAASKSHAHKPARSGWRADSTRSLRSFSRLMQAPRSSKPPTATSPCQWSGINTQAISCERCHCAGAAMTRHASAANAQSPKCGWCPAVAIVTRCSRAARPIRRCGAGSLSNEAAGIVAMRASLPPTPDCANQEKHHRGVGNEHLRTWSRQPPGPISRGLPSRVRITGIDPT